MDELKNLQPEAVFDFFREIAAIPHGSGNTGQISDYLVKFAKDRGLEYYQDEANNVVIFKPASPGYEDAPRVMIQGHMDMVCEKTPDSAIDMEKDGLTLAVDGDWLYAENTTLGGDDGIAVAMALAAMDSDELQHPGIDAVFTVDEEIGMLGAEAIDVSRISARKMINIDSEEEGIITVSCAGGVTASVHLPVRRQTGRGVLCHIRIDGLLGGHSGIEIDKEHGNANIMMGRLLYALSEHVDFSLVKLAGGTKDNAICKLSEAEILTESADIDALRDLCDEMNKTFAHELRSPDPEVCVTFTAETPEVSAEALDRDSTRCVIAYLMQTPNGIQNMSTEIEGLVETSLNLGALSMDEAEMVAVYAVRSSVATRKDYLCDKLESLSALLGGSVQYSGAYPGWEYREDSVLRDTCIEAYTKLYGKAPEIDAIHAGLECGLFAGKMGDDFDAVSFGPDMSGVHTTDEKLSISSVERTWKLLCEILKNCR